MSGGKIEHEVVEIRGVSAEGLKHIINYIYTSELRLNMTNIREVLAAAGHMQLKAATNFAVTNLNTNLTTTSTGTETTTCIFVGIVSVLQLTTHHPTYPLAYIHQNCSNQNLVKPLAVLFGQLGQQGSKTKIRDQFWLIKITWS